MKIHFFLLFFLSYAIQTIASPDLTLENVDMRYKNVQNLSDTMSLRQILNDYETIFEQQKRYSPQMLLKMAGIAELLNDYPKALRFLTYSYFHHQDLETYHYIQQISYKHNLRGYRFSETDHFIAFNKTHFLVVSLFEFGVFLIGVMLLAWRWITKKSMLALTLSLMIVFVLMFMLNIITLRTQKGIIRQKMYMMQNPSASAEMIEIINEGDLMSIIDEDEFWYKVRWNEQEGFIRKIGLWRVLQ